MTGGGRRPSGGGPWGRPSVPAAARGPWPAAGEDGNVAVEFALVLPLLLLILTGIVQLGMMLFVHNNMLHVAQETARQVAVGAMTTAQAQIWAGEQLIDLGFGYAVSVQEAVTVQEGDSGASTETDVTATISVPIAAIALFDPLNILPDRDLVASSIVRQQGN